MVYVEKKKQFKFQLSIIRSNVNTIESNVIYIFNVCLPIYTCKEFLHNDTFLLHSALVNTFSYAFDFNLIVTL